jgi:glyoxylate reductase
MASRGVWATNTPDSFADATADCALALLLALVRRIPAADRYVRSGQWAVDGFQPSRWEGNQLSGKCLGIIGFGRIGRATARRAAGFGMRVIHHTRSGAGDPNWRSLPALLAESEVVALHCPLTLETRGLIDAAALAAMRPGAILLNLARGPVVDESALAAALRSGHLGGAGLDDFEAEPRVNADLLDLENVVLTPHIGGGTIESRADARLLAAENVARVLRGERPITPVNDPTT